MNLFDFLPPSSIKKNPFRENCPCSFEYFNRCELNQRLTSINNSSTGSSFGQQQEMTSSSSPACSIPKHIGKTLQRPDVFGKVFGPTADESILVGIQALIDVAGTLDFSSSTADSSRGFSSGETSDGGPVMMTQSSVSCQCSRENLRANNDADLINKEILNVMRKPPCQYIITQENIAAAVTSRRNKCQQSQTRVLPKSMTCYNPERATEFDNNDITNNMVPCPNLNPENFSTPSKSNKHASARPISRNQPLDNVSPTDASCSKFYHQTTTISVLENPQHENSAALPRQKMSRPVDRPSSPICPCTCDAHVDTETKPFKPQKSVSITCEPCFKNVVNTPIQTLPQCRPKLRHIDVETDSIVTSQGPSVACDCNFCMPISAGLSNSPSTVIGVPTKVYSRVRFADEKDDKKLEPHCSCSMVYSDASERNDNSDVIRDVLKRKIERGNSVRRNKSCSCCLIKKGVVVADASCSCLRVNTSCQYYKTENSPNDSKSTQCENKACSSLMSSTQCSESGDFRTHRKKSVRILSGPCECSEYSEKYGLDPDGSLTRSFEPLIDFNDDYSKVNTDRNGKVRFEMGDTNCVPPPLEIRYAITKITKFKDFSTFEVMKSTSKKPKCMPKSVEGVFVLKKEEAYCNSKNFE